MTLIEVINARRAVVAIVNRNIDKVEEKDNIPFKLKYKLIKFLKSTNDDEEFFQKQLGILIDKYAARDENGNAIEENNGVRVQPEMQEECAAKIEELHNLVSECNTPFLKVDELDGLDINYSETASLFPFVIEE